MEWKKSEIKFVLVGNRLEQGPLSTKPNYKEPKKKSLPMKIESDKK